MSFDMSIERRWDDVAVVGIAGEFDLAAAPEVKTELSELVDDGVRELVVDMTETTFLDSTALGAIVSAVKRLQSAGGELSLVCTDRSIVRIFEITGLDRVIPLHRSLDDALSRLPLPIA